MNRNVSSFTVLFQPPFWVGIAQRWSEEGYQAAKVTFGAEPTDAQVFQWLGREWHRLKFTRFMADDGQKTAHTNPKRLQREARRAGERGGSCTKAQEAIGRQREQEGRARQVQSRQARQEEAERKFLLRQQKKREKKRGR